VATSIGENLARDAGRVERLIALEASEWNRTIAYLEEAVPRSAGDEDVFNAALARIARTLQATVRPSRAADPGAEGMAGPSSGQLFVARLDDWLCYEAVSARTDTELRLSTPASSAESSEQILRDRGVSLLTALLEAIAELPDRQRVSLAFAMCREDRDLLRESLRKHAARLAAEGALESAEILLPERPVASDEDIARYLTDQLPGKSTARQVAANRSAARQKLLAQNPAWAPLLNTVLPYRSSKKHDSDETDPELASILEDREGRGSLRLFEIAIEDDCPRFAPVLPLHARNSLGQEDSRVGSTSLLPAADAGFERHIRACTRCRMNLTRLTAVVGRDVARDGAASRELGNPDELDPRVQRALVGLLNGEERQAVKARVIEGLGDQLRLDDLTIDELARWAERNGKLARLARAALERQAGLHPHVARLLDRHPRGDRPEKGRPTLVFDVVPSTGQGELARLRGSADARGRVLERGSRLHIEIEGLPNRFEGLTPSLVLVTRDGAAAPPFVPPDRPIEDGRWTATLGERAPWMEELVNGELEMLLSSVSDSDKSEIEARRAQYDRGARSQRDLIGALAHLRQQHFVVRGTGNLEHEAAGLSRIGALRYELGQFDQARSDYEEALAIAEQTGYREVASAAHRGLGESLHAQGDTRAALDHFEKALELARALDSDKRIASTSVSFAHAALDADDVVRATRAAVEARDRFESVDDVAGLAAALNVLALSQRAHADYTRALTTAQDAINALHEEFEKRDDAAVAASGRTPQRRSRGGAKVQPLLRELRLLGQLHCTEGRIYLALSDYNRAQEAFTESLALAYRAGYRRGEADAIHVMGRVYHAVGLWTQAEASYQRALAITQLLGDRRRQRVAWGTLARLHADRAEALPRDERQDALKLGLDCVERTLELAVELRDHRGQAMALTTRSRLTRELWNDAERARADLERARELRDESRDLRGSATTLMALSDLDYDEGFLENSVNRLKYARRVNTKAKDPRNEITILEKLGERRAELAERHAAAGRSPDHDDEIEASRKAYDEAVDAVETLRANVADPHLRDRFFERYSRCYRDFATRRHMTDAERAFAVADAARARGLLDCLTEGLGDRIETDAGITSTAAMSQTRQALPEDGVFLSYVVNERLDVVVLFVVDRSGVIPVELGASARELKTRARDLIAAIDAGRDANALAYGLYRDLVAPAAGPIADRKRLLISPDGFLHDLPFASLVRDDPKSSQSSLLIDEATLTIVPSLGALDALRRRSRARDEQITFDLLVVGSAPTRAWDAPASEAGEGPDLADEARRIIEVFGRDFPPPPWEGETHAAGIRLVIGDGATKRDVAAGRRVVRYAHVAADSEAAPPVRGAGSWSLVRLRLAGDDRWHQEEIVDLGFVSRLVTLTAASAATGQTHSVEGRLSLARVFLMGGSEAVVASTLPVARDRAVEFSARLYRELVAGTPTDEAMRRVQISLAADGWNVRDWAGFRLVGVPTETPHGGGETS
jgi:tetratricopeptide (TPR) repeat protein